MKLDFSKGKMDWELIEYLINDKNYCEARKILKEMEKTGDYLKKIKIESEKTLEGFILSKAEDLYFN